MTANGTCDRKHIRLLLIPWILIISLGLPAMPVFAADSGGAVDESSRVMQGFTELSRQKEQSKGMSDKKKHVILFGMGISLVILVLTTAGLGLAMALYRKPVFVAHMISAGMTVTLALVHALAAMIWFFPF
jgi:hypothetical protein